MVEVKIDYEGELHCAAQHGPSGARLATDAPADIGGRASSFSPTDLVAVALATCIATTMAMKARQWEVELRGVRVAVRKQMSDDPPRRILALHTDVWLPAGLKLDDAQRAHLQRVAHSCPVAKSLHPAMAVPMAFHQAE